MAKGGHVKHYADGGGVDLSRIPSGFGGLTSSPTIMSGQVTAAPSPAPMAPPVPQGMPTQAALQAWQNAGSPSNHNFFGSDTPEPQVFTGGYTAPVPEMKPSGPVFENDLEFMAKRGLSPNGQPPSPQLFTGGYTAPTPEAQPAIPMYQQSMAMPFTSAMDSNMFNQPMQTASMNMPQTGVINPTGLRNFNPSSNRNPFMAASVNPRAPMNPFNPGFAAQRPTIPPTQPRPGTMPRPPQTFNPQPMGGLNNFRGPIAQQRVAAGLSQLARKPMFRRYDEGGLV
jgi:hypothetical protein